ncbi:MAG: hypothetical protein HQM10_24995 [Candidatus Riflebacteria bacterium]|nr:hypothetical protein [Candidatus Riflebacteria bacterium]
MKMNNKILTILFLYSVIVVQTFAFEGFDATHLFEERVKRLAKEEAKETLSEFELRTKGFVQNADVRPKQVGDVEQFNCFNIGKMEFEKIPAVLKKIGKNCYIYLEQGKNLSEQVLNKIVYQFDEYIYPTTTSYFGKEWNPGIDGDPKICLFFLDIRDGFDPSKSQLNYTSGYFFAGDEYSKEKEPMSNQREMLYLDIYPSNPEKKEYMSVVAHELQHMIHWHHDAMEHNWINESMSQLASFLNGFGHPQQVLSFWRNSDNNMLAWSESTMIANYGQVYMYGLYLATQLASDQASRKSLLRTIVECDLDGSAGILKAFKSKNIPISFQGIFSNFCVACFVNDPSFAKGLFSYKNFYPGIRLSSTRIFNRQPFSVKSSVKPWSARAFRFNLQGITGPIMISFQGAKQQADDQSKSSNSYAIAAILQDSKNRVPKKMEWLTLNNCKTDQILKTPAGQHDSLQVIVVNRGPVGKIEMAFAVSAPAAPISFSVTIKNNRPSTSSNVVVARSKMNKKVMRSVVEMIASQNEPLLSRIPGMNPDIDISASVESAELPAKIDHLNNQEEDILETVRYSIEDNEYWPFEDFVEIYQSSGREGKNNLYSLKNKLTDLLKFEATQNNSLELNTWLEKIRKL